MARAVARALAAALGASDPWDRFPHPVPIRRFGHGSVRELHWYFQGDSVVTVRSLDEVCAWLLGCRYVSDPELFGHADYWQHPRAFETLRCGDCEDFALWAWRKLVGLGFDAELVSGALTVADPSSDAAPGGHAWVCLTVGAERYVLECVARSREQMLRPLDEARHAYVPYVSADRHLRTYAYYGLLREGGG